MKRSMMLVTSLLASTALAPAAIAQDIAPETIGINAEDDPARDADTEISAPGSASQAIVVRGKFIPDSIRSTPQVVSVLSTEDIARTGAGDIAGALTQVTGLSVVGNGYVYVRGLGDRYSLALLNGLPLPSPEPLKRVVPLDIFPTSIIGSAVVQKSYSANYPGEFGGGVINLTTTAIPDRDFLDISAGISGDTETTGQLGYTHYGSDTDWTGFDDGERSVPGPLANAFAKGNLIGVDSLSPELAFDDRLTELQDITASLANSSTSLAQNNNNIPANWKAEISGGLSRDIGVARLGLIASAGIDNSWTTRDATKQLSTDPLLANMPIDSRVVTTDNHVVVNGLLGLGLEIGDHKVRFTNIYIHDTVKRTQLGAGTDDLSNNGQRFIDQDTAWYERQLFETQLVGEFRFGDFGIDLRGTYANSKREAPYERSFRYIFDDSIGDYVNNLSQQGGASISFGDLNEDIYGGGIDLSYKLPTTTQITVSAGYNYNDTKRYSIRRDFRFLPLNGALPQFAAQQRPDYLLSDINIRQFDILLSETSTQSGAAAYDAALKIHAGYAMLDIEPVEGVGVNIGVRYEDGEQSVRPLNVDGTLATGQAGTGINRDYWLPAATITWNFAEDMQLRLNASKTIARPQFRELADQVYQDIDSDRQFLGNPFLTDSRLTNAEARFEWYFARDQRLTVAGFYKKIKNPIEVFSDSVTGLRSSFVNAPSAMLYGAEFEIQKFFEFYNEGGFFKDRRAVLIANYTYTQSDLNADDSLILTPLLNNVTANQLFTDGTRLTGQSDHLVNLQLGLESTDHLSAQTLIINYASNRITSRGPFIGARQPDFIEKPGISLDFVMREAISVAGHNIDVKLQTKNILGTSHQEFQKLDSNRIDINSYDIGTSFSVSATLKF